MFSYFSINNYKYLYLNYIFAQYIYQVEKIEDQLEQFINYAERFGVPQEFIFDPIEDLMLLKDIPKVTRCLALMAKMVYFSLKNHFITLKHTDILQGNVKEFEDVTIEIPIPEEL